MLMSSWGLTLFILSFLAIGCKAAVIWATFTQRTGTNRVSQADILQACLVKDTFIVYICALLQVLLLLCNQRGKFTVGRRKAQAMGAA